MPYAIGGMSPRRRKVRADEKHQHHSLDCSKQLGRRPRPLNDPYRLSEHLSS